MTRSNTNLFLQAYGNVAGQGLLSRCEFAPLPFRTSLFEEGTRPRYVHFLTAGLSSVLVSMVEGAEVEVAMFGNEGFSEAVHLLGPENSPRSCVMQIEGACMRIPFTEFERLFEEDAKLRRLVLRLIQYQSLMSAQLVACNGQHDVEQRLARWLLMSHDRVATEEMPLTQDFLGTMLGARRSTVTVAASTLQRAGLIDYRRGHIKILNRERLEDTACECYGVVRDLYTNLIRY